MFDNKEFLKELNIDYLLVNCTNEFLVEYSQLSENSRYKLTGFSGSTGDALVTKDNIYLFVDGRYHIQAEQEAFENIKIVKLQMGQNQDYEIKKIIKPWKKLGIVAKKVSQARIEKFKWQRKKLLDIDPINNYTEKHSNNYISAFPKIKLNNKNNIFISNLEEVSYITGYRDFSNDYSSKIWAKMIIHKDDYIIFTDTKACENYLKNFKDKLFVDKNSINAYDYSLIKKPIAKISQIKTLKSIKTSSEILAYKEAFKRTDNVLMNTRSYIESNDNLSEADIESYLRNEFYKSGAKSLSFKPIVAINENSALAHYSKCSREKVLNDGDLVLIDCGAYYESGLATDITRVFVKGKATDIQKKVYTTVLRAFLHSFNSTFKTGYEIDTQAHNILDNSIENFVFSHGLGHGIGINVHEAPPALNKSKIAKTVIQDGMCFTIEPGLYNPNLFGIRLENSCYKNDGKIYSFVKMGYEGKLIDYSLLSEQEKEWLKEFEIL